MAGDEVVDLVDGKDRIVGEATVKQCLEGGLLHRAVAVLVVRSGGGFVLQQRSKRDLWQPGLWTISCTGHVKKGESYESAASRELLEELGLEAPVRPVKKYKLPAISTGGLTEDEWVTLFICRTDSACVVDHAELETVAEVNASEFQTVLREWPLTPDARLILTDYFEKGPRSKGPF